jgi:hypothetical protein
MQKLVWSTGFLVSIVLAQIEYCLLPENSPVLRQSGVLLADSSLNVIAKPSDVIATDVLQESLYGQILSEINNPNQRSHSKPPEHKYQLLEGCRQYYPNATLRSDTLIIPYPDQKVERFKEIKYFIPAKYFGDNDKPTSLQPKIQLHLNPDKSTLMINNSYLLSYYRSPGIKNNSLEQCTKVLQYIFNLLLPYTTINGTPAGYNYNAIVHYKGYKEHEIKLDSEGKFYAFWESLSGQGSLYFFPSKIDDLETRTSVYGLLYVMKDDIVNAYHFGELKVTFSKLNMAEMYELRLVFYPFVMNKQIGN